MESGAAKSCQTQLDGIVHLLPEIEIFDLPQRVAG